MAAAGAGPMRRAAPIAAAALAGLLAAAPARAADVLASQLAGRTLSAVAYVAPGPGPVGHNLRRVMLQAYLEPDGRALLRQWVAARDSYSAPTQGRWSVSADRLCIDLPAGPLCARVQIWGPRIAGIGVEPYAMLDGDLQPGNAIVGTR
jgi:hypothetical protein